jgi:NAD(P)H-hydrate epimerase
LDRHAIDTVGVPQAVLMENAGRSAAAVLQHLYPHGSVLGLIGAGNNGGDALVLLRTLKAWGRGVRGILVADRSPGDPLLHGWSVPLSTDGDMGDKSWEEELGSTDIIVDGILGTGVRGAPRKRQAAAIERVNATGLPVLSMDVPSGTDSSTGAVPGEAIRADATVAFGAPKLGTLLHPARAMTGRLIAVEIAFSPWGPDAAEAWIVTPGWARDQVPPRATDTHKKAVGSVLIVAGGPGMAGAAILAGRAAFRSGAGLVRVCSVPENRLAIQAALPEAIYVDASDLGGVGSALRESDAVAVGPGLGTAAATAEIVAFLVSGPPRPTVLDADALNLAAAGSFDLAGMAEGRAVLVTPHAGEMARLLDRPIEDRVGAAREAVSRFGCTVLLKGAPSLVASEDGILVDTQSSSDLAVAGMGDALTGVCGSLMAQGLGTAAAGAAALYHTGRAARLAGRGTSLTPSDVVRWLPEALAEEHEPQSDLALPFVVYDADPAR